MQRIAMGICLAATVGGCSLDDGEEGFAAEPLASVELATGMTVDFYEPVPGSLMVMQSAEAGVAPLRLFDTRPVDLYRTLAPGSAVPDALMLAQARNDELLGARVADPPPSPGIPTADVSAAYIANQSCDDQWFETEFCSLDADWEMCLLNHWNGAYAVSGGVNFFQYIACADIGNITLRVMIGGGGGGVWDVLEGHYKSYNWYNPWSESSTRGDILNATNNRFHYSVLYLD